MFIININLLRVCLFVFDLPKSIKAIELLIGVVDFQLLDGERLGLALRLGSCLWRTLSHSEALVDQSGASLLESSILYPIRELGDIAHVEKELWGVHGLVQRLD